MSQAENLLSNLSEDFPAHAHSLADSDSYFTIDPVTRVIANPTGRPITIMQRDHNSTVYTFQLPRYIDGHDMMLCNRVKCHFNNIEYTNEGEEEVSLIEHPDVAELIDLRVNPENNETVICSWTITRQATSYEGALGFFLQYVCVDNDGNETYEWHTDEFTSINVKKTKHNDEAPIIEYTAIFEQWRNRIFGAGDSVKNEIASLTNTKLAAIESEGSNQRASVSNEGLRVLGTIPEDYTAMSEQVDLNTRFSAPVIRQETEGKTIDINDSAKMPVLGLQMFGKSDQKKTTGYQLFDASTMITKTEGGATVTKNYDDSFTVSGSGTITATFNHTYNLTHAETVRLIKSGMLKLKCEQRTHPYFIVRLNVQNENKMNVSNLAAAESEAEVLQEWLDDETSYLRFTFYGVVDANIVPGIINPMLYQDGDGTWEPYTGGVPSPSPEWPQEIESVGRVHNLLPNDAVSKTVFGITYTVNADGSITADGHATDDAYFILNDGIDLKRGNKYILSGCPNGGSSTTFHLYIENMSVRDVGSGVRFATNSDVTNRAVIVIKKGVTVSNITFYPMLRKMSVSDPTYHPYTGEPSITTYLRGKNLFDISKALNDNFVDNGDGSYTMTRNDGTSRFSNIVPLYIPAHTEITMSMKILEYTKSSKSIPYYFEGISGTKHYLSLTDKYVYTVPEDIVSATFYLQGTEEIGAYITIKDFQLEIGSDVTDYEKYMEPQILSSTCKLPGLPVESGGNYVDSNGQQYICNYRDWERGVDVYKCKELILTGGETEGWQTYSHAAYNVDNVFRLRITDMIDIKNIAYIKGATVLSNYFEYGGYVSEHKPTGIGLSEANYIYLRFDGEHDAIVTTAELRAFLNDKYVNGNPVEVVYVLAKPIETPIPEAELQAYRALHTNYPNTTILNNSDTYMKVAYAADTKMYIDNKFAELQAALIKES